MRPLSGPLSKTSVRTELVTMEAGGSQQVLTEWTTLPLLDPRDDRVDPERHAEGVQPVAGKLADGGADPSTRGREDFRRTAELARKSASPQPRHVAAQPPVVVQVTPVHSKPEPPTAKVAPLLGPHSGVHRSHVTSRDTVSPSNSPAISRAGHIGTGSSSPTFDCRREKLQLLERDTFVSQNSPVKRGGDLTPGISMEKMRSLMTSLTEKTQIIER